MKTFLSTDGYTITVDDKDFRLATWHIWRVEISKNGVGPNVRRYAVRRFRFGNKSYSIYLHREIIRAPNGISVDHINGDGLDNRRSNLRFATTKQNCRNARLSNSNTSGRKGVSRSKRKWRVQIRVNGKLIRLGRFSDLDVAAKAYDAAAKTHFGEFARTNESLGLLP